MESHEWTGGKVNVLAVLMTRKTHNSKIIPLLLTKMSMFYENPL